MNSFHRPVMISIKHVLVILPLNLEYLVSIKIIPDYTLAVVIVKPVFAEKSWKSIQCGKSLMALITRSAYL